MVGVVDRTVSRKRGLPAGKVIVPPSSGQAPSTGGQASVMWGLTTVGLSGVGAAELMGTGRNDPQPGAWTVETVATWGGSGCDEDKPRASQAQLEK
jgi:hypothetical protein